MELVPCTASLSGDNGQWNFYNTVSHCLGAVGCATSALQCVHAWGHWVVSLLQYTASVPGGSGQCHFCNTLPHCVEGWAKELCKAVPHCLAAAGSGTLAIHLLTVLGQWAVELLQYTASLPRGRVVELLHGTASLPGDTEQWNSCNAPPHCLRAMGGATSAIHCLDAWGHGAVTTRGLGTGTTAIHCLTAWGSGQYNSCNTLPHSPGAVGSGTLPLHCLTA